MRNKYFFWGGVLLLWVGFIMGTLWVRGYQPQPSGRPLSDEDLVRMVVRRALTVMEANPPEIVSASGQAISAKLDDLVPYDGVDHFLAENPNCCPIEVKRGATDKIIGVSGKVFYRDEAGQIKASEPVSLIYPQHFPEKLFCLP